MKFSVLKSKWFHIPYLILLYGFAVYGFFLTVTYFAVKYKWTNDGGSVDENNRYFAEMSTKYNQSFKVDSVSMVKHQYEVLNRIMLLNNYYPKNADYIINIYKETKNEKIALKMLDAVDIKLKSNKKYMADLRKIKQQSKKRRATALSVFDWMNIAEWKDFKIAVSKDKSYLDSVYAVTGVEPRLIVACLVGEQIRLFNSGRESYKRYIGPLKVLALENHLSYGITGIKNNTAIAIENNLKNKSSVFYPGDEFQYLLDFDSTINYANSANDTLDVRLQRLVQWKNHYYNYLYTALYLRQIKTQWEKAGFPIDNRPEILASLFNLGYQRSIPKKNPAVGGSVYQIKGKDYTFGSVAFEFYYSGELHELFPFHEQTFTTPKTIITKMEDVESN